MMQKNISAEDGLILKGLVEQQEKDFRRKAKINEIIHEIMVSADTLTEEQVDSIEMVVKDGICPVVNNGGVLPHDSKEREILDERLRFESLISELSTELIDMPVDKIGKAIETGQKLVCNDLGFDESWLIELSPDRKKIFLKYAYSPSGAANLYSDAVAKNKPLKTLVRRLEDEKVFLFSHYDELTEDKECEEIGKFCRESGTTACVIFPLKVGDNLVGAISWECRGPSREFPFALVERLRLVSEAFANALCRKRTEDALKKSLSEIEGLKNKLQAENLYLLDEIRLEHKYNKIIGSSNAIKKVLKQVEQVSSTAATVLVLGETGTGKELLAHAIHNQSDRKDRAMVSVNCSALPQSLIESELFGHEKGAFSGAVSRRVGRFEIADQSTIFLDEIGELPLELQAKLLRVLQEGQFERLGSSQTRNTNVRVIAATNRNLEEEIKKGNFREDLYYRLNIFPIITPALKDRKEDIPLLVKAFSDEFARAMGKVIKTIPNKSLQRLSEYHWPGNIRELRNTVERAVILANNDILQVELPQCTEPLETAKPGFNTLLEVQQMHILKALDKTDGRIFGPRGAAKILDINPRTLISRMKRLGIQNEAES